ncbi:MAG TPA: hypothetical protein VIM11_28100 [Tepidisphaeraceae bacterium]|jgi:hypothetical protein
MVAPYLSQQANDMRHDWAELPPLPDIGLPESYYAQRVKVAEQSHNQHAREAYKVGQYVTLGLDKRLDWEKKLRYFRHALRSHCNAPAGASDKLWLFYGQLADMVRRNAGTEALRLASQEDDYYMGQVNAGVPRQQIMVQATIFFSKLLGDRNEKPEYLNQEDYDQLRILRNQWI